MAGTHRTDMDESVLDRTRRPQRLEDRQDVAQAAFTERMFYGPTNARAQVAPAAMARTALAPEFRSRVIPLDWNEMLRLRETWNQRWRRDVIAAASR